MLTNLSIKPVRLIQGDTLPVLLPYSQHSLYRTDSTNEPLPIVFDTEDENSNKLNILA